jgi:AraC-like DNA-binding protein
MKVTYPTPPERVSEFVQGILVIENCQSANLFELPLFANGTPTLLFHTKKGQLSTGSNYLTLFGQTVSPDRLFIKGEFTLIAYFLKPYSLPSLFATAANELADNPIDFNLLSMDAGLQDRLLNARTTNEMCSLMDDFLSGLIAKVKVDQSAIKYAVDKIGCNTDKNILVHIQNELCLTERTFQRMFERNVGVPPNQFRRIIQFNKSFQQLNSRHFKKLSDISLDNGYADQNHYIRSFKEFTNITPTNYLNAILTGS